MHAHSIIFACREYAEAELKEQPENADLQEKLKQLLHRQLQVCRRTFMRDEADTFTLFVAIAAARLSRNCSHIIL